MEVIKRKAMQQLWHYRPQTCSGDKKQWRKYHSYPLTSMEHNSHKRTTHDIHYIPI